jgi:hypothetical protein
MRWGRWLAGGVAALAIAGALVFYFAFLPGTLATDYRDSARPEHAKAVGAMRLVYATFVPKTFAQQSEATERAKGRAQYVRASRREIALERRALRPARTSIREARAALKRVDEKAFTDVPDPPAIGGSGKLGDAHEVATRERRYMRDVRSFLSLYERLVDYKHAALDDYAHVVTVLDSSLRSLPENPTTPEQVATPIDAMAARLDRATRPYLRRKPPPGQRFEHRRDRSEIAFYVRELRALADAARARDLAKVKALDREVDAGARRYSRGGRRLLRRLITRSRYAHSIAALRKLELKIDRGYDRL